MIASIDDLYPESAHVRDCGLASMPDDAVWAYAMKNSYVIVPKDSDFSERSVLLGSPPKAIWLRIGNCTTVRAGFVLRDASQRIHAFMAAEESCLILTLHA